MTNTNQPTHSTWLTIVSSVGRGGVQRNASSVAARLGQADQSSHLYSIQDGAFYAFNRSGMHAVSPNLKYSVTIVHNHGESRGIVEACESVRSDLTLEYSVWGKPNRVSSLVDGVIHLSNETRRKYERLALGHRPAVVVGNSVQDAFFSTPVSRQIGRARLGVDDQRWLVGRIGQPHTESKWHPGLISAFSRLSRNRPEAVLVLVGPPASIRSLAQTQLEADQLRVIDWLDSDTDIVEVLDALDVYAHWSRQGETFGISVVEAIARGLPVVTMRVREGDNAHLEFGNMIPTHPILVAKNLRSFQKALRRLQSRPERRAIGGLNHVFSVASVAERIRNFAIAISKER